MAGAKDGKKAADAAPAESAAQRLRATVTKIWRSFNKAGADRKESRNNADALIAKHPGETLPLLLRARMVLVDMDDHRFLPPSNAVARYRIVHNHVGALAKAVKDTVGDKNKLTSLTCANAFFAILTELATKEKERARQADFYKLMGDFGEAFKGIDDEVLKRCRDPRSEVVDPEEESRAVWETSASADKTREQVVCDMIDALTSARMKAALSVLTSHNHIEQQQSLAKRRREQEEAEAAKAQQRRSEDQQRLEAEKAKRRAKQQQAAAAAAEQTKKTSEELRQSVMRLVQRAVDGKAEGSDERICALLRLTAVANEAALKESIEEEVRRIMLPPGMKQDERLRAQKQVSVIMKDFERQMRRARETSHYVVYCITLPDDLYPK